MKNPLNGLLWLLAGIGAGVAASWFGQRRLFFMNSPLESTITRGEKVEKALIGMIDLREARLAQAVLPGTVVGLSNLEETDLSGADLHRSIFGLSNGEEVNFSGAQLDGSVFGLCNLEEANFDNANLRGAIFDGCVLRDATFENADLTGAQIKNCACEGVTLPDGSAWSPSTDWGRFTQTGHPQYWKVSTAV